MTYRRKRTTVKRRRKNENRILFKTATILGLLGGIVYGLKYDTGLTISAALLAVSIPLLIIWDAHRKASKFKSALLTLGVNDHSQLSPLQYEQFCALLLEKEGWKVSLTKASGDQGADIIAQRKSKKMVVQCKHWQASVGTKAVQEVYAARAFYSADIACVIGSSGYTKGAIDLAKKTGVGLIHHNSTHIL